MAESSSVVKPCHYVVLSVARDVSVADIGATYHKLVEEWQLERDSSMTAESRASYLQIKEAYEVLSDASMRALYDAGFSPALPDYQLSNSLFPPVNRLLAEMEGYRKRVTNFNNRIKKDPTLTRDHMLGMLEDINKPENPPQAAPKRRGRPPKNKNNVNALSRRAGGPKMQQPAATGKPPGKKAAGFSASNPSPPWLQAHTANRVQRPMRMHLQIITDPCGKLLKGLADG
ncbi:unnamed protein product [Urochloa humidicola]